MRPAPAPGWGPKASGAAICLCPDDPGLDFTKGRFSWFFMGDFGELIFRFSWDI